MVHVTVGCGGELTNLDSWSITPALACRMKFQVHFQLPAELQVEVLWFQLIVKVPEVYSTVRSAQCLILNGKQQADAWIPAMQGSFLRWALVDVIDSQSAVACLVIQPIAFWN